MLRRTLQIASSRVVAYGKTSRYRLLCPASAAVRLFSDFGGGKDGDDLDFDERDMGDDEARMSDIYSSLFGGEDAQVGGDGTNRDFGRGSGGFGNYKQRDKRNVEDADSHEEHEEDDDEIEEDDIPLPLFQDCIDIKEHEYHQRMTIDDIPDWSKDFVSKISLERVQLLEEGIPTLSSLAYTPLPPPAFPHPGHGTSKEYALLRRRAHQEYISQEVAKLAEPEIAKILALSNWQEKQDAVDELFESIELQLRGSESILQGHPKFGIWVEQGLESYLKGISRNEDTNEKELIEGSDAGESTEGIAGSIASESTEGVEVSLEGQSSSEGEEKVYPSQDEDKKALPVYMDCYSSDDPEGQMVPTILTPLKPHHNHGPGRMVEEWELAADEQSKRIMLRQSTREIARALQESQSARVFVTGKRGCGKSACIASIVASARKSGHIVLYMPDGNRLHRHGYYIEPSEKFEGFFNLPILSQEVCQELLHIHEKDFEGMEIEQDAMEQYFTEEHLKELAAYSGGKMSVVDVLKAAEADVAHAPMCYTVVVNHLMKQDDKPFLMVLDEFNCYFEPGHYFHMAYDFDVKDSIPYDQINLFKPALDAIALSLEDDEDVPLKAPVAPKRGGVVVGISESCAIARKVTDSLSIYAARSAAGEQSVPLTIVDVPRFSELEVDHVMANFECIGLGHLRCDRGETVMNEEGIAYLKMVSSNVGQNLIDVCCS